MRPTATASAALLVMPLFTACSCASPPGGWDAGPSVDGGADGGGLECDGEYLVYDYQLDGEPGTTGCKPAQSRTTIYPEGMATSLLYGEAVLTREQPSGLPAGMCGTDLRFYNTPLVTGETGPVRHLGSGVPDDVRAPQVVLPLGHGFVTGRDPPECVPGGPNEAAMLTGGTWHVLRGGSEPGEWVEVEARDVTFEPLDGHTFRFDRMQWRVQLREPLVLP